VLPTSNLSLLASGPPQFQVIDCGIKAESPGWDEFKLDGIKCLERSLENLLATWTSAAKSGEKTGLFGGSILEGSLDEVQVNEGVRRPPGVWFPDIAWHNPEPLPSGCKTAMLRNIPRRYTRRMLVTILQASYKGDMDFVYLPVDFKNEGNMGSAFINFRNSKACRRFAAEYHHVSVQKKLPGYPSCKFCEVHAARVQGLELNVQRLRNSPVMAQLLRRPDWMPVLFNADGDEICFVVG